MSLYSSPSDSCKRTELSEWLNCSCKQWRTASHRETDRLSRSTLSRVSSSEKQWKTVVRRSKTHSADSLDAVTSQLSLPVEDLSCQTWANKTESTRSPQHQPYHSQRHTAWYSPKITLQCSVSHPHTCLKQHHNLHHNHTRWYKKYIFNVL